MFCLSFDRNQTQRTQHNFIMESEGEIVCVTGASGFIGSWLIMLLLERGYVVRATLRDPGRFLYHFLVSHGPWSMIVDS